MNDTLQAALLYERLGLNIIPIPAPSTTTGHDGKKPAIKWRNFQNNRVPHEVIANHFMNHPNDNIAIITGKLSRLLVLDIDIKPIANLTKQEIETQLQAIIDAIQVHPKIVIRTGGGGVHIYLKHQPNLKTQLQLSSSLIAPNTNCLIDIKSEGGYVIAPPSTHKSTRPYMEDPRYDSLSQLQSIDDLPKLPPTLLALLKDTSSPTQSPTDWNTLITQTTEGSRNVNITQLTGLLLRRFEPEYWEPVVLPLIQAFNNSLKPPLPPQEIDTIFKSIADKEIIRKVV